MILKYLLIGIKKIWKRSEFILTIALILIVFKFAPYILRWFDPQAGEFSVDVLYIPIIAGIFFFIGLWFIWIYLVVTFNKGYKVLDNLFAKENIEKITTWEKLKLAVCIFACLVFLYGVSLLAASGMSGIML